MKAWQRPLDLLEAAYRLDGSDDDWMRELVATMGAVFVRGGLGAAGFVISGRIDEAGRTVIAQIRIPHVVGSGGGPGNEGLAAVRGYPQLPPDLQQRLFFSSDTANTTSVVSGLGPKMNKEPVWTKSGLDSIGASDGLGLNCHENPMDTVVLAAALREVTRLTRSEVRLWQRIAAHVGAARRLRSGQGATPDRAEAVFSIAGKVQHLVSRGDEVAIKDGFARRRHARARGVPPDAALEVWQGLHDGRWSLVDYVDTDGKAFVLAVRNEPAREVASTLTDRQRAAVALAALGYGNKQIAYALGLRAAAVAMLLVRARAATGVRTRAELVRSFKRTLASGA